MFARRYCRVAQHVWRAYGVGSAQKELDDDDDAVFCSEHLSISSTGPIFRIANLQLSWRFAILCTRAKIPNFGDIGDCDVGPKLMYRTCDSNINLR